MKTIPYNRIADSDEFSHRYACWANNHNGWAKSKKMNKKIAKKKLKRISNKEIEEELEEI